LQLTLRQFLCRSKAAVHAALSLLLLKWLQLLCVCLAVAEVLEWQWQHCGCAVVTEVAASGAASSPLRADCRLLKTWILSAGGDKC
jgi:hypothetical protein